MPLPPLPWSLKIVAGQSIEGDTHRFAVDPAGRLRYERVSPRTWKVVAERDHLLRPDERTRLSALVDHERIAALTSQDFTREPLHLDQPHYTLDLAAARATHVELGMGPGAIGAHATDRERRVDRLLLLLASIAGVELR